METDEQRTSRPVRRFISYLIATGPAGDGSWRLRFTTVLALAGPGSVPFALLLSSAQAEVLRSVYGMTFGAATVVLTGAAVVLSRFRPVLAWLLLVIGVAVTALGVRGVVEDLWPLTAPGLLALLVVQFALARDRRVWVSIGCWLGFLAGWTWVLWAVNARFLDVRAASPYLPDPASDTMAVVALFTALAFLAGLTVRIWRQGRARVAEETRVAEDERTRRRVLEERTRIARELHDVVAHHMSVIAVQASTAEYRIDGVGEAAREEFRSISEQARESLAEMRRLLAVLRNEEPSGPREPMPGPEGLAGLVEAVDRSGTPAVIDVSGLPVDLPETVGLTVFRVVQEALSNVVRHAAGAATRVEVRGGDGSVAVTVVNAAPPSGGASPEPRGAGLGLVGMRERVVIAGGELEAGPADDGGFRVRAVLPTTDRSTAQEPTA